MPAVAPETPDYIADHVTRADAIWQAMDDDAAAARSRGISFPLLGVDHSAGGASASDITGNRWAAERGD